MVWSSGEISQIAQQIAQVIESEHPDLVTSRMSKVLRPGKVFIDWSQNNGNKTTIAPYSLRGRPRPTVAAVRTWDELADPDLRHLEFDEVLERVDRDGDLMAALGRPVPGTRSLVTQPAQPTAHPAQPAPVRDDHGRQHRHSTHNVANGTPSGAERHDQQREGDGEDRLGEYRAKRSAERTPEPIPQAGPQPHGDDDTFVIQEHHARRLHWDLRLERNGVLVSWAVPRGVPENSSQNRLAVQTEDHPLEYAAFSGTIPAGEYGGGDMTIWDAGTYETEKWWTDEVIVRFDGRRVQGRYVLVRTDGKNWLLHRMKDQAGRWAPEPEPAGRRRGRAAHQDRPPSAAFPEQHDEGDSGPARSVGNGKSPPVADPAPITSGRTGQPDPPGPPDPPGDLAPMLATAGTVVDAVGDGWRFEGKWDGIRALATVGGGELRLTSRSGRDITAGYPELVELVDLTAGHSAVLDGELVALDQDGRSDFGRLQQRMGLSRPADVRRVAEKVPVHYFVFDILWLDGVPLIGKSYDVRRRLLTALNPAGDVCRVPEPLPGPAALALESSADQNWEGIIAKKGDAP